MLTVRNTLLLNVLVLAMPVALSRPAFAQQTNIGFVVIDRARTPEPLRDFAVRAFRLQLIESDGIFELYRPS